MSNVTPNLSLNKFSGNLEELSNQVRHAAEDANLDAIDSAVGALQSGGAGPIRKATVTLSAAQLLNLHTTPVQIVPAPGPGKVAVIWSLALEYVFKTTPYVINSADYFTYGYGAITSFANANLGVGPLNLLDQVASTFDTDSGLSFGGSVPVSGCANLPIVMSQERSSDHSGANWTAGDGTLVVTVFYSVVNLS